jgi:hypothetical protein
MNEERGVQENRELIPSGAAYTLKVYLNREKSKSATFHIKDITEDVYLAAKTLTDKGKDFDAVRLMIKTLHVGGDSVDVLKDNIPALQSATRLIYEILAPFDGELKKIKMNMLFPASTIQMGMRYSGQ